LVEYIVKLIVVSGNNEIGISIKYFLFGFLVSKITVSGVICFGIYLRNMLFFWGVIYFSIILIISNSSG